MSTTGRAEARILTILEDGPKTTGELRRALMVTIGHVRKALAELVARGRVRWTTHQGQRVYRINAHPDHR